MICLAIAQVLLDRPNERKFLRAAKRRLGHLFPAIPKQSEYNKRFRGSAVRGTRSPSVQSVIGPYHQQVIERYRLHAVPVPQSPTTLPPPDQENP